MGDPYLVAKYTKHKDIQFCHLLGTRELLPTSLCSPWQVTLARYSAVLSLGEELAQQLCEVHRGSGPHGSLCWPWCKMNCHQLLICVLWTARRPVGAHSPASVSLVVIWTEELALGSASCSALCLCPLSPFAFCWYVHALTKSSLGRKGLTSPHRLESITEGDTGQELEQRPNWLVGSGSLSSFLYIPGLHATMVPPSGGWASHITSNQKNAPHTCSQSSLMGAISSEVPSSWMHLVDN